VTLTSCFPQAESAITGPIVVEDVELDSGSQGTFRRLVFTRNQNLVQSEAALTSSNTLTSLNTLTSSKALTSANGDARKKKGGKKVKERAPENERKVDHSLLTSEYHAAMVAGLALVMPLLEAHEERNQMVGERDSMNPTLSMVELVAFPSCFAEGGTLLMWEDGPLRLGICR
jgi:hypothetical protein